MWKDKNNSKLYMVKENGTIQLGYLCKKFKYGVLHKISYDI
jgi:hypothetical protein